ncbi:flippase [Thermoproteota archaeon]
MNYARKALKGTISVFVVTLFAAFLGYLVRLVLARGLSLEEYGLFYAVFSFFGLFMIFKDLGLNSALAKFIPEYLHKKDYSGVKSIVVSVFSIQTFFSLIVFILTFLLSDYIAEHFFHTPAASIVIKFIGLMFLLTPLENVFTHSFQGFQRMFLYASIEFMRMLVILLIIIALLYKGFLVLAPSIAYFAVYIIVPLLCIPFFLKMFPQFTKVKAKITSSLVKKLFKFGVPLIIGSVGAAFMLYTDTVIITYFRNLNEVALYQVASPTARLLLYLGYALAAVILPLSSELWAKGKRDKLKFGMELLYKYTFLAVIPLALLMFSFPELILNILFGAEYTGAAIVMQILAVGTIFFTVGNLNGNVLAGIGRPKEIANIVLIAAVFNLIANLILVPFYGMIGAAFSTLLSWLVILVLTSYKMKKYVKVKTPFYAWIKNIFAGIIFVLIIKLIKSVLEANIWVELLISVGIASLVYLGLVLLFRLITKKDINFFLYSIGRKKGI